MADRRGLGRRGLTSIGGSTANRTVSEAGFGRATDRHRDQLSVEQDRLDERDTKQHFNVAVVRTG